MILSLIAEIEIRRFEFLMLAHALLLTKDIMQFVASPHVQISHSI